MVFIEVSLFSDAEFTFFGNQIQCSWLFTKGLATFTQLVILRCIQDVFRCSKMITDVFGCSLDVLRMFPGFFLDVLRMFS